MFTYCDRRGQRNGEKVRQRERQREGERNSCILYHIQYKEVIIIMANNTAHE